MDPWNNSMEQALQNSLILHEILKKDAISAKVCRLVCHQWNEVILSLPQIKLYFWIDRPTRPCCLPSVLEQFPQKLEPRILRGIKIGEWEPPSCISLIVGPDGIFSHSFADVIAARSFRFIEIFNNFSKNIQEICGSVDSQAVPMVHRVLKTCCPTLRRIELNLYTNNRRDRENREVIVPPFQLPLQINVTSLTFIGCSKSQNLNYLAKCLLEASPNVKFLTFESDWYPDLSSKRVYALTLNVTSAEANINFEEVARMLNQVSGSLQKLRIKDTTTSYNFIQRREEIYQVQQSHFLPVLPNLTLFQNDIVDMFHCGLNLENISVQRLPKLETLILGNGTNCTKRSLDPYLENMTVQHNVVTSLTLKEIHDTSLIALLRTNYPHLETLEIQTWGMPSDDSEEIMDLSEVLNACSRLGLKHLVVDLRQLPKTLSTLIDSFLENLKIFEGLKTLQIRTKHGLHQYFCPRDVGIEDDLTPAGLGRLKTLLYYMGKIDGTTFDNFIRFKDVTKEDIAAFIVQNRLPIVFKCGRDLQIPNFL